MKHVIRYNFLTVLILLLFITSTSAFGQAKQIIDKYAPRMEEFENIDKEINMSSVKTGVSSIFEETVNQFSDISKALVSAGVDISDLKKLLNAVSAELDGVPSNSNKATSQNSQSSAKNPQTTQKKSSPGSNGEKTQKSKSASSGSGNTGSQTLKKATAIRKHFIEKSLELRGIPYRLGSNTPDNGLDCSGFIQYSAKINLNRNLPRTANEMYSAMEQAGKLVKDSEREPGDLVFFKENPYGKITHVGIYLGKYRGSGRLHGREIFLNSASAGPRTGVVISALDEPYWKRTYYKSGRFLPQTKKVVQAAKARQKANNA